MAAGSTPKRTTRSKKVTGPTGPPAAAPEVKKVQIVAVVDPEMLASLDAFVKAQGLKSRSEAVRVFLDYGRTQAERWKGASAPTKRAAVPARAPRTATTIKRPA
jgi:hypothetical protein